jgi:hypothetical protein
MKLLPGIVKINAKRRITNRLVPPERKILAPPQCITLTKKPKETMPRMMLDENPKYLRKGRSLNLLRK